MTMTRWSEHQYYAEAMRFEFCEFEKRRQAVRRALEGLDNENPEAA